MRPSDPSDTAELRRRAEALLREKQKSQPPEARAGRTMHDTQRLVQELQIHQIELEMQNEQLERARAETEVALERYIDLYEFAPSGYFTLGRDGTIRQANLTGSKLGGRRNTSFGVSWRRVSPLSRGPRLRFAIAGMS